VKTIIALALTLLAGTASAQDYARPGAYVGFSGVGAIENFDISGANFSDGGGFNFRGGYRLMSHLAVEAQFEYVTGFSDQGVDIDALTFTGGLKGYVLTEQIQPYGVVAFGLIYGEADAGSVDVDDTDPVFRVGGGVDVYITENWLVNLEAVYVAPVDDMDDFPYASIGAGIGYRF
jgi:opacity protein-like surface antigen